MITLLLMGVGSNSWLPYLWVLLTIAAIVQFADWLAKFIKERKRRRWELKHPIHNELLMETDALSHDLEITE